ncbi:hypothetical protein J7J62_09000 [bacterium]|nr:hypothetical protein [bacterium]
MYRIELVKNGVKINGKPYQIGDYIKATDKGKIKFVGKIKFGVYLDSEGYVDDQHIGFIVEDIDNPIRYTLIDLINTGWKLSIAKDKPKVKVKLIRGKVIYEEE